MKESKTFYDYLDEADSIIKNLSESSNRSKADRSITEDQVRFTPKAPTADTNVTTKDDVVNTTNSSDSNIMTSDINDLTELAERRDQRYMIYDSMRINDSFAAAALEMYADDITQPDPSGRAIWVESSDEMGGNADIASAGNRLFKLLKIEDNLWATAYALVTYGDVYFELFRDVHKSSLYVEDRKSHKKILISDEQRAKLRELLNAPLVESKINIYTTPKRYVLEDYIERIEDPSEIFDLVIHGQTVGYARTHVNEDKTDVDNWDNVTLGNSWRYQFNRLDIDLYDSQKFIHMYVPDAGVRHPYKLIIKKDNQSSEITETDQGSEYTVPTGKSLLQDAYKTSQQLQLLETSIILSRLAHAAIYRLHQVQVGQKGEIEVASILQRLKSLLDKKQVIDTMSGRLGSYNNPPPQVSNVFIPVKENGQGGITTNVIGGDYDPKNLTDIDYLVNKELAAFKIPRQFFNFTDGGGFNGGSSLAKISAQYAHRIVRFKRAIIKGYTDLLNIYFKNRYPDYVGKFEVKMTPINTIEDAERVSMARDKLNMVASIMDQIDQMDDIIGKFKILKDAFEDAYPNSVVSKVLDDYIKKLEVSQNGEGTEEVGADDSGSGFGGGDSGDSSFMNDAGGDFGGSLDDTGSDTEVSTDTDSGFPTDLGSDGIDYTDTAAVDSMLGED